MMAWVTRSACRRRKRDRLPEHGQGNGTPARYMECMEFFLRLTRSTARQPRATRPKRLISQLTPGVVPLQKAARLTPCKLLLKPRLLLASMMVVAAGNSGSGCSTVPDPPSFYAASYTAGALNTGTDTIAGFSSRGPVTADGSGRIKPDSVPLGPARAQPATPAIMHTQLPAARPWPLRTSPAQWRCCGRLFQACGTRLPRVATL